MQIQFLRLFRIGCGGATGVSAGLVTAPIFFQHVTTRHLARRSLELYAELAQLGRFKFTRCGRVFLASSKPYEQMMRRMYSRGVIHNAAIELIDCPSEMLARWPFLQTEDILLAMYSPEDVALDPVALCQELAKQAEAAGAEIHENCAVQEVLLGDERQVYGVNTNNGFVETPRFVDASGIVRKLLCPSWTGTVLVKALPYRHIQTAAYPCTYTYIHSSKLPTGSVTDTTPIFNDLDGNIMIRATGFKTLCAGFPEEGIRPLARHHASQGVWTHPEPDWDLFGSSLEKLLHRCPMLGEIDHGDLICGMEAYTPDKVPTVGQSSQARGYYVMNGLNGQGLALAAMTYRNIYNSHQFHTARNLRMSPIYHQLRDAGAVFGEIMGYERPLWFEQYPKPERQALFQGQDALIGKPVWFDSVASEYEACRERVGLIDMSSFTKYDIVGPDVVKFLQYLCSANVDRPIGTTVYTGMQHARGGYVTDCTLSRLSETSYFMVAPTIQQERCMTWMKYWVKKMNVNVHIQDVTGMYTALDVVGPSSRYLMADVTEMSMSTTDFPTFRCQLVEVRQQWGNAYRSIMGRMTITIDMHEINIGMATGIRAISVTHCGELGWVVYIPNEVAQNVYERIVEAGHEYSLLHAGYYTLRQLRIEKFYVYWGQDIDATVTPVECGRSFRVDFKVRHFGLHFFTCHDPLYRMQSLFYRTVTFPR
ncbi:glycine cleavage T-protein [Oesophagostomum dentatum]|uniref:Glycine cleavage T-protein n=1 Tax=Oesophagostomum dentatum TaxID=61180 RepID=A0A0B1SVK5_OESDE|nr:glycine cleavage T-protein [Oesophagostomum dentatum]